MKISKFRLINEGFTGVSVEAVESINQGNLTVLDKVSRLRTYPVPEHIRAKISKLKYFYLNLTHHWIDPFDKCFDNETYDFVKLGDQEPPKSYIILQTLMNHTKVLGVTMKNAGFVIIGTIESVEGKKISISTPFITEEDDVSFFTEASDKIEEIMNDIAGLLKSTIALPFDEKQVLMAKGFKEDDIAGYSKQEMIDMVIEGLQDKGAIVLMNSDGTEPAAITDGTAPSKLHQKSGSIDSHRTKDAIEQGEDDNMIHPNVDGTPVTEDIVAKAVKMKKEKDAKELSSSEIPTQPPADKKPIGKGSLASEGKFPDLDTGELRPKEEIPEGAVPGDMEFSENMGIPIQDQQTNQGEW
jgi:hypothetical protein